MPETNEDTHEDVTIKLMDGKERVLQYSLAASKRVSRLIKRSMLQVGIGDIDEEKLGLILWHGLWRNAKPPEDIPNVEAMDELIDMAQFIPLMVAFSKAWIMANRPKNDPSDQPKAADPLPEPPATFLN